MKTFFILSALLAGTSLAFFDKCELATLLRLSEFDGYQGYSLADWTHLLLTEMRTHGNFRSFSRRRRRTVPSVYRLLQINSKRWCEDVQTQNSKPACGTKCDDFINDNIADDIQCLKRVVRDRQGMNAWNGWKNNRKRREHEDYLDDCHF
ncbi:lysozyme C-like [Heptranchias perlo]|uniref:lysozyme C-like n=1 Tax=Heptranchias perlo TaxID=212740 RepID=UPI003559FB2C